jgi:hypothetical protein
MTSSKGDRRALGSSCARLQLVLPLHLPTDTSNLDLAGITDCTNQILACRYLRYLLPSTLCT